VTNTPYVSGDRTPAPQHAAPAYAPASPAPAPPPTTPTLVQDVADLRKLIVFGLVLNVVTLVLALGAAFFSGYVWYTLVQLQKALQHAGV
jgi:hypothetical protein